MVYSTQQAASEAAHAVVRGGRYAAGMGARGLLKLMTAAGAAAAGMAGSTGVFMVSGLIGVGTGVGLHAYLNHKDYEHNVEQLTKMYSDEVRSFLTKKGHHVGHEVGIAELQMVGQSIPSLSKQLQREKEKRNVHTGSWLLTAAIGFGAASAMVAGLGIAAIAAAPITLATFHFIQPIVNRTLEKQYGLDKPSTPELARSMEWQRTKGKQISKEQIMEAYVAASPALDQQIEAKFGKHFWKLNEQEIQTSIESFAKQYPLQKVADAMNSQQMNPREIVFFVHGEKSDVAVDASVRDRLQEKVSNGKEKLQNVKKDIKQARTRAVSNARHLMGYDNANAVDATEQEATEKGDWVMAEENRKAERANAVTQL